MYKRRILGWEKHLDFILLDILSLQISFVFCYMFYTRSFRFPYASEQYRLLAVLLAVISFSVSVVFNTMHNVTHRGYAVEFGQTLKQILLVFSTLTLILFALKTSSVYSRLTLFYTALLYIPVSYFIRLWWKRVLRRKDDSVIKNTMILVVPEDVVEAVIERNLASEDTRIVGIVLLNRNAEGETIHGIPVVANLDNAATYICREWVDEVFIYPDSLSQINWDTPLSPEANSIIYGRFKLNSGAAPATAMPSPKVEGAPVSTPGADAVFSPSGDDLLSTLLDQCRQMAVPIHIRIPFSGGGGKSFVEKINGYNVITTTANYASPLQLLIKRIMDIFGGIAGSILAILIILIFGPIIKIKSPGPILFKQERIGRNGKHFKMFKLRTMYMDAEERKKELMKQNRVSDGMMFKLDFDPRIIGNEILPDGTKKTGIGEFLRRTSLDEFPQFFNVLKGDMSLVGTRPPTLDEWEKYEYHHRARLSIRPGITGMWQVSGRSKITDFEEVVRLDTEYINNWSVGLDIRIIIKTIISVLHRDGAM